MKINVLTLAILVAVHINVGYAASLEGAQEIRGVGGVVVNRNDQTIVIRVPLVRRNRTDIADLDARVTALEGGPVPPQEFVAGTYAEGACELYGTGLPSGRSDWYLTCLGDSGSLTLNFVTGEIAGNPYEAELTEAGIDQLNGVEGYAWGLVMGGTSSGYWWSCISPSHDTGQVVSGQQVGNRLNIKLYGYDNQLNCGFDIVLVPE